MLGGGRNGKLTFKGYKASVIPNDQILEICCITCAYNQWYIIVERGRRDKEREERREEKRLDEKGGEGRREKG